MARVDCWQKSGRIVYTKEMPWMETTVSDERARFVRDFESGHWSMTELCERYVVSRPTGYKWVARRVGGGGFADRSHAPHR
jgi:hypothetical protein